MKKKTDEDIAVITATPGRQSGRRWYRVALAAAAMALSVSGLVLPAAAATTSSAVAHQGAHATVASVQLTSAQQPIQPSMVFPPPGGGGFNCGPFCGFPGGGFRCGPFCFPGGGFHCGPFCHQPPCEPHFCVRPLGPSRG